MSDPLDCQEYELAMARFMQDAVESAMNASDTLYARLTPRVLPEDVRQVRVDVEGSSTPSPSVHMSSIAQVVRDDVIQGNMEQLNAVVEKIAHEHLFQFMPAFFDHVGTAAEAVGNSVDLSNERLTWDRLLDQYERVEWAENERGHVEPPQLAVGDPEGLLQRLGDFTEENQRRWASIQVRKEEEHVSRRRSRRLR